MSIPLLHKTAKSGKTVAVCCSVLILIVLYLLSSGVNTLPMPLKVAIAGPQSNGLILLAKLQNKFCAN